ncbi:MAG: agmatine deiminase family protein [Chitinophagales bacterium]
MFLYSGISFAQAPVLPNGYAPWELDLKRCNIPYYSLNGIVTPPQSPVRASAEWEEIDALMVTWTSYIPIVRDIVKYAREECDVYIVCDDSNSVKSNLITNGISLENIFYIQTAFNSIWIRDYGPWNIYKNNTDSLYLIDWVYNRPRPEDDAIPAVMAEYADLPIYQTIDVPYDLVHTGGNFMTDGWGTGFSSKLILDENDGYDFSLSAKSESEIDSIMLQFMGINRYIKMETLPYDEIHHIDMHLKLLDEETLLVGEYPEGVADGPQIEENLQYILDNYNSVFGTPYKVVRIPMPPDFEDQYPDEGAGWNTGDYRTYTNCVFINKTVLVPVYEEQYDTTAIRILKAHLPGYNVVGIECNDIIQSLGAIHCITKEISTNDPLVITHQPLADTENSSSDYVVNSWILHKDGIDVSTIFYSTDGINWLSSEMVLTDAALNLWTGYIPAQPMGSLVEYYIYAKANNGKEQVRPITAPDGFWHFRVGEILAEISTDDFLDIAFNVYPNPVVDNLHFYASSDDFIELGFVIKDITGQIIYQQPEIFGTDFNFNIPMQSFPSGNYLLQYYSGNTTATIKVVKL